MFLLILLAFPTIAASQQIFKCVCGEDVDDAQPFKLIPLEDIKQDFFNRAAVSDFHPIKAQMQVRCVDVSFSLS